MAQYTIPQAISLAELAEYVTDKLDGSEVGVGINNFTPTVNSLIGDFVEPGAEYGGYARVAVTAWGPEFIGASGPEAKALIHLPGPTSGDGDNLFTWFLVDSDGALCASGRFDGAPIQMTQIGSALNFVLASRGMAGGDVQIVTV